MKKAVCFALILFALLVCAAALADVNITSSGEFDDPNFQEYLLSLPAGADRVLTDAEIEKITEIEIQNSSIRSLKGIKLFKNLTFLDCSYNSIQDLDVSGLAKLKYLHCENNKVTSSLDVSGCSALQELSAYNNSIKTLKLSGCSALQELIFFDNQLASLDARGLSSLNYLTAYNNNLSSLDISGCPRLKVLNVSDNKLTSVNVSSCASFLQYLDLANNLVSSLSIKGCSSLIALWCYGNKISTLDITPASDVKTLFRTGNKSDEGTYFHYYYSSPSNYDFEYALAVDKSVVILSNTVSFNANGGSGTMDSFAVRNGVSFTLPANSFTRSGWKFVSWNTKKDGSGLSYADKTTMALHNQDLMLHAQWEQNPNQPQQPVQPDQEAGEQLILKKPSSLKLKALSKKKIKVSWKKLSAKSRKKIKYFQIQVSTDPEFRTILKTKFVKSTKSSCTFGNLKKNTKYYIRIRSYTEKNGIKYVSKWVKKVRKTKKK